LCSRVDFNYYYYFSLDIFEKLKNKKPLLDIEKAVNREMNQPSSDYKGKGLEKKSKTQLKKVVGKMKHKSGKSIAVNKGKGTSSGPSSRGKKAGTGSASASKAKSTGGRKSSKR